MRYADDIIVGFEKYNDANTYLAALPGRLKKINSLIQDIARDDPYTGIGKPEPLKLPARHSIAAAAVGDLFDRGADVA